MGAPPRERERRMSTPGGSGRSPLFSAPALLWVCLKVVHPRSAQDFRQPSLDSCEKPHISVRYTRSVWRSFRAGRTAPRALLSTPRTIRAVRQTAQGGAVGGTPSRGSWVGPRRTAARNQDRNSSTARASLPACCRASDADGKGGVGAGSRGSADRRSTQGYAGWNEPEMKNRCDDRGVGPGRPTGGFDPQPPLA